MLTSQINLSYDCIFPTPAWIQEHNQHRDHTEAKRASQQLGFSMDFHSEYHIWFSQCCDPSVGQGFLSLRLTVEEPGLGTLPTCVLFIRPYQSSLYQEQVLSHHRSSLNWPSFNLLTLAVGPYKHQMPRADWGPQARDLSPTHLCPLSVQFRGRLQRARRVCSQTLLCCCVYDLAHVTELSIMRRVEIRARKKA